MLFSCLSEYTAEDMKPFYANLKKEFDEEAVNKMGLNFSVASYGAAVTAGNTVFSLAQNTKRLHKLALPTEKPKKVSCYTIVFKSICI